MARVNILKPKLDALQFSASVAKMAVYPSSLGACPRKFAWERAVQDSTPKFHTFKQQQIFDIGNSYHDRYAKYIQLAGLHVACELPINDPSRNVRGRLDNVVEIDNNLFIVELKTTALKNWKYIYEKANPKHRLQIGYYMQQTGIHDGLIVYLAKGAVPEEEDGTEIDFPMVEHHVKYTKKLETAVNRSIQRLTDAMAMLPALTTDVDRAECSYCSFRNTCEFSRIQAPPTNSLFEMFQREQPDIIAERGVQELEKLDAAAELPEKPKDDKDDGDSFWSGVFS